MIITLNYLFILLNHINIQKHNSFIDITERLITDDVIWYYNGIGNTGNSGRDLD